MLALSTCLQKGSTFEHHCDTQPILEQLQQDVAEVTAHNGLVLLTGGFNARTGEAADTLDTNIAGNLLDNTLQPAVSMPLPLRSLLILKFVHLASLC